MNYVYLWKDKPVSFSASSDEDAIEKAREMVEPDFDQERLRKIVIVWQPVPSPQEVKICAKCKHRKRGRYDHSYYCNKWTYETGDIVEGFEDKPHPASQVRKDTTKCGPLGVNFEPEPEQAPPAALSLFQIMRKWLGL